MFWDKKKPEEEKIQDSDQINTQAEAEEEEVVVAQGEKKRYLYMAVDKDQKVILKNNGEPYFSTTVEGTAPDWPKEIRHKAQTDIALRVELAEPAEGLSKKKKDDEKRKIRDNAKEQLFKMGAERIAAAKEMQNPVKNNENNSDQTDSVKPEETSAQKEVVAEASVATEKKSEEAPEATESTKPVQEATANMDLSAVIACVEKNAKQLGEDLTTSVDDLIEIINNNGNENNGVIKSYVEAQAKRICDTTLRAASDADRDITQKTQKYAENIVSRVNENGRSIGESQEKLLSKVNGVGKRVTDLGESVEGIEGKLSRLEQLDEIAELLRDKGLNISRDIPPVNADEEDIINLVRYSQKITEQLGYAARDLIRKQEAFKSQEESNANEQRMMEQKIAKAHAEGVEEGKKAFVKQLLSKYEDVDTIRESDNNHVHAIWTLLMELGVSIDGEGYYEKGKEIELTASDIEKMMGTYSKLEDAGKYRVVRTGLCFQGEILCKAAFEKGTETAEPEAPKAEENPETGKAEGEPEATSEETK